MIGLTLCDDILHGVFLFVKITPAIMQCKHLFQKGETYYEDDE